MASGRSKKVVLSADTGWNNIYSGYCRARLKNGVAEIKGESWGELTLVQDTSNWHDLTTLPSQYRPTATVYMLGASINGNQTFRLRVETSGIVSYINSHSGMNYWMFSWLYNT